MVDYPDRQSAADLLRTTVVASIGPLTAEATAALEIPTTIMPAQHTVPALVDAIVTFFERTLNLEPSTLNER